MSPDPAAPGWVPGLMQQAPLNLSILIERAASLYPEKTVTTMTGHGAVTVDYATLADDAARLAATLRGLGIQPGDRVATFAHNSADHLAAHLAIPGMGAVLVPLNVRFSPAQIRYILAQTSTKVVLAGSDAAAAWQPVEPIGEPRPMVTTLGVRDQAEPLPARPAAEDTAARPPEWPVPVPEEAALALCYTSGTTGDPKGVAYSHRSTMLHALAGLFADGIGIRERDVVLPAVPQYHALAWGLPYSALLAGAALALPGPHLQPQAIARLIQQASVTVISGVPTVWTGLLEAIRAGQVSPDGLRSVERLYCGGAPVPASLIDGLADYGIETLAAWGMTETSPVATYARVKTTTPAAAYEQARRSLGLPFPGIRHRIMTADGPAPWDGTTSGELEVSGPWVADAYYTPGSPDHRGGEDCFRADPDGSRWLRTGDIAVIDADGYAYIVDRDKDLIRSGGESISSVTIENTLLRHPAVAEAAVVAAPHPRWGERPHAFVVTNDQAATADELKEHLTDCLPRWQVPDWITIVPTLPRTAVGKIDKRALRDARVPPEPGSLTASSSPAITSTDSTRGDSHDR